MDIDDKCPDVPGIPELQGCPPDKPMVLEGVNFHYNSANLTAQARGILDTVAKTMKAHPKMTVKIIGYTSAEGEPGYNQKLSERRAKSVKQYLSAERGIAANRMKTEGRGERNPRASNANEEGRAKNRRIEFELLSR